MPRPVPAPPPAPPPIPEVLEDITITEDEAVSRGGVQVLTESGRIDATLEAQMDQILKNIDGLLDSQSLTRENIIKTSI